MTAILAAPAYVLARAAWIPTRVLWHVDGRFTSLEGETCTDYAAALAASYALRLHETGMIKNAPKKLIAQGADWRFFKELKQELKG